MNRGFPVHLMFPISLIFLQPWRDEAASPCSIQAHRGKEKLPMISCPINATQYMHSVTKVQFFHKSMVFSWEEEWVWKPHTLEAAGSCTTLKNLKWHKASVKQTEPLNSHLQATTFEAIHHFWSLINECEWQGVQPAPKTALTFSSFCLAVTTLNNYFSGFGAQLGICCAAGGLGPAGHHWTRQGWSLHVQTRRERLFWMLSYPEVWLPLFTRWRWGDLCSPLKGSVPSC